MLDYSAMEVAAYPEREVDELRAPKVSRGGTAPSWNDTRQVSTAIWLALSAFLAGFGWGIDNA